MAINHDMQEPGPGHFTDGGWSRWKAAIKRGCMRLVLRLCAKELLDEMYHGVLGRNPDPAGAAAYRTEMVRRGNLVGVLRSMLTSEEFHRKQFAAQAPEIVKGVYRGLLGREPEAAGLQTYAATLAEGRNVTGFVSELANSHEHGERRFDRGAAEWVKAAFKGLLGRDASEAEAADYTARLVAQRRPSDLFNDLAASEEFQKKYRRAAAPTLVSAVYRALLGREPDPEGQRLGTDFVAETGNFAGFISQVAHSAEFADKNFSGLAESEEFQKKYRRVIAPTLVSAVYRALLGREPDPEGQRLGTDFVAENEDFARFITEVAHSAEFADKSFLGAMPEVLRAAYRGLLGREAQPADLAGALQSVAGRDPAPAFHRLVESEEFQKKNRRTAAPALVSAVYRGLLGREPDPEGQKLGTDFVVQTEDFARFIAEVAHSAEFADRSFLGVVPEVLRAAYRGLLGREAQPADLAERMAGVTNADGLAVAFKALVESPEFEQDFRHRRLGPGFVEAVYRGLLDREPDAESAVRGADYLARTQNLPGFVKAVLDSAEFQRLYSARLAPELVKSAYRGILHREALEADLAAQVPLLIGNQNWAGLLAQLSNLPERLQQERNRLTPGLVKSAYRALSGREASADELEISAATASTDAGLEMLLKTLAPKSVSASPDKEMVGSGTDQPLTADLVRAGFLYILGRDAMEKDVKTHVQLKTINVLRLALIRSVEFTHHWNSLIVTPRPGVADTAATKTVLLHIPKTGGTTMHEALLPFFAPKQVCPERFNGLHRLTSGSLATYKFFSGHFTLDSCGLIPGPKRILTMLRHPVDRLVSLYNFSRAHSEEVVKKRNLWLPALARRYSIDELFALEEVRKHPSVNNAMVRVLASSYSTDRWEAAAQLDADTDPAMSLVASAEINLRALLAFGILERYQESAEMIFEALGFPLPEAIKPKMVLKDLAGKAVGMDSVDVQKGNAKTLELLKPLVEADLILYNFAGKLFEERLQALRAGRKAPVPAKAARPVRGSRGKKSVA